MISIVNMHIYGEQNNKKHIFAVNKDIHSSTG